MSESSPALSIGLAVRNGRDVIERCIESVLSQDFTDLELVVCDNASDDGTIEMLDDYARADSAHQVERQSGQHRFSREHEARARGLSRHVLSLDQRRRLAGAEVPVHMCART